MFAAEEVLRCDSRYQDALEPSMRRAAADDVNSSEPTSTNVVKGESTCSKHTTKVEQAEFLSQRYTPKPTGTTPKSCK